MTIHRVIASVVLLVVAMPAFAQESTAVVIPVFEREWGSFGSGPGQFNVPRGIATGPDGSVYVADLVNFRVQKFTSDGQFVLEWGGRGFGPGQFGWYSSAATGPWGIAVAPDGTVLVGDPGGYRVQRFTVNGAFLHAIGSSGSGPGQLSGSIRGIAVDQAGNVFVSDPGLENRITKFSADGTYLTMWGGYGCCQGLFRSPVDFDIDSQGYVWVTDAGNSLIQVFDNNGAFIVQWGTSGSGAGEFGGVESLAFGQAGSLFVADTANNRVEKFVGVVVVQPTTWGAIKSLYR